MNIIIIAIAGLITLVSLLGNLYLIGCVLKETYAVRRVGKKKKKKNKTLKAK